MIEETPKGAINNNIVMSLLQTPRFIDYINQVEEHYYYWDKIKYRSPEGVSPENFWAAIKLNRAARPITFGKYTFKFKINDYMQKLIHSFDLNLTSQAPHNGKTKKQYLLSSIMEEAIASCQMEGATTTRKVAKEMLITGRKPRDVSQQMILNNYKTIHFLTEIKDVPLSKELLLDIQRKITKNTLGSVTHEGHFRTSDNIVVLDETIGEVAHFPPNHTEIDKFLDDICNFANNNDNYTHPIVKAIILHFMISFLHPFYDGNGRTARSIFYWYMLKNGYWLTEYLSISRIIYSTKEQYEKAFLHTEHDENDLGYFIHYNLKVLDKAYFELKKYLDRKEKEEVSLFDLKNIASINLRQAHIIKIIKSSPHTILIAKELQNELCVSVKTIRSDLEGLVKLGLLDTRLLNKRLRGYVKSKDFDTVLHELQGTSHT